MLDLSRREVMITAAATAALAAGVPAAAVAQATSSAAAWDLTDLYPSDAAWETERQAILAVLPRLKAQKGTLGRSPAAMRSALLAQSDVSKRASRLFVYASLKADEDRRVGPNQERKQQAQDVFTSLGEATAWTNPEIVAIGPKKVNAFIAADPVLKKRFAFGLRDALRLAPHILSPADEALLASAGTPLAGPQDIHDQLASSDIPRPTVKLSDGTEMRLDDQGYTIARQVPNRADRKMVFDKFWASYKAFENSLGAALGSQIKGALFQAKARHYDSALQSSLDGGNIPEGGVSDADRRDQSWASGAAALFRAAPADAWPARPRLLGHLPAAGEVRPDLQPRRHATANDRRGEADGPRLPAPVRGRDGEALDGPAAEAGESLGRLHERLGLRCAPLSAAQPQQQI